jgi:uncharacterized membrane protein
MESKVKLLGHPIHPMLIVFPLGLLATAVIFDLLHVIWGTMEFATVAFWMIAAGILGGLIAASFGFLDWLNVPGGTRAKRIGLLHGAANLVVVTLFAMSFLLRLNEPGHAPTTLGLALELVAAGLAFLSGWLGGEMVDRLGIGVDEGANANAPNSLSGKRAYESEANLTHVPVHSSTPR